MNAHILALVLVASQISGVAFAGPYSRPARDDDRAMSATGASRGYDYNWSLRQQRTNPAAERDRLLNSANGS